MYWTHIVYAQNIDYLAEDSQAGGIFNTRLNVWVHSTRLWHLVHPASAEDNVPRHGGCMLPGRMRARGPGSNCKVGIGLQTKVWAPAKHGRLCPPGRR